MGRFIKYRYSIILMILIIINHIYFRYLFPEYKDSWIYGFLAITLLILVTINAVIITLYTKKKKKELDN